jgi:hypothetical protein
LTSLYETLSERGADVETIKENIRDTCSRTMQILGPMIEHQIRANNGNKPVKG